MGAAAPRPVAEERGLCLPLPCVCNLAQFGELSGARSSRPSSLTAFRKGNGGGPRLPRRLCSSSRLLHLMADSRKQTGVRQTFLDEGFLLATDGAVSAALGFPCTVSAWPTAPRGGVPQVLALCGVSQPLSLSLPPGASCSRLQGCAQVSSWRGGPWPGGRGPGTGSLLGLPQRPWLWLPYSVADMRGPGCGFLTMWQTREKADLTTPFHLVGWAL